MNLERFSMSNLNEESSRINIVNILKNVAVSDAKLLLVVIAQGVVQGIKDGNISITLAENIIFNLDILMFCKKRLKDRRLTNIIEIGMELEDIEELIVDKMAVARACTNLQHIISTINFS
jgi:hypothetical protein